MSGQGVVGEHNLPNPLGSASISAEHLDWASGQMPTFSVTRSLVHPVSRVWFELSDSTAFERSVELAVAWMSATPKGAAQPRSGVRLPIVARQGGAFDITDELGANPTKAVRLEARDGVLWAARLDWPDPQAPRTWVSEFFVEKSLGQMVRFGAQLTCVRRGECPPTSPTRPVVVRKVLETLSAEADGRPLSDTIDLTSSNEIDEIVELLYKPTRRLPVVVISGADEGGAALAVRDVAHHVAGSAHIIHLSADASWELTRQIGKRMSVFGGAVRLYQPGLSEIAEDPFAHPLWLARQNQEATVLRQIIERVLPAAFLDRSENAFRRYAEVRNAAARLTVRPHKVQVSSSPLEELELSRRKSAELAEERDLWMSLADEQQAARLSADNEVERLKVEVARLEAKATSLEFNLSQRHDVDVVVREDRRLESYDDLEAWGEEVLGDSVYIHSAALKDCRKSGHMNMLQKIESALLVMRDHMTVARRTGDVAQRDIIREKLGTLGFEDAACFSDRDEAKRRPQYSVIYNGETRILYDHLKYGNGYNNANQVRIYYFWDSDTQRHVVGKMPSHLPNNLTN